MELGNVLILYFMPDSRLGNGVAVFDSWNDVKEDKALNLFSHYIAYWVAGVKLIFIFLLFVILFTASQLTKVLTIIAMILSISTYFFKLHPILKRLDDLGKITPKGYSKKLKHMIIGCLCLFIISLVIYFLS